LEKVGTFRQRKHPRCVQADKEKRKREDQRLHSLLAKRAKRKERLKALQKKRGGDETFSNPSHNKKKIRRGRERLLCMLESQKKMYGEEE